jgi:hypothetical protein
MTYLKELCRNFCLGEQEDHEKTLVRIVGIPAKSWTIASQIQVTNVIS